jgi:hypothetical protein
MANQWLWIMVCYAEPVVVNHGVLCWASDCESWCAMLNQWLCIMVCYAEPVVVNHGVLFWASGCESYIPLLHKIYTSITQNIYLYHTKYIPLSHKIYTSITNNIYLYHTKYIPLSHKIYYIIYNVQDYSVLYNNGVRPAVRVGILLTCGVDTCMLASFHYLTFTY